LFVAKDPLLDLRLYAKRTFLNANLLGYVAVIALFGAEFMMPLYLQFLRGKTAFQTGLILVPMAITGGITTIIAGRLYDKLGPRPLVVFGYSLLIFNTWQLSQIKADTPVSFIMFLLALRGLAVGATVQTTFVTALSVVPLKQVARGSSLTNATRQVIQSIGIAILAAVLASALSPQISALQQQFLDQPPKPGVAPLAVCTTTPVPAIASANPNAPAGDPPAKTGVTLPPNATQLLAEACQENIKGFESAYKITFYAAFLALALGLMLPGWPLKFAGRRTADAPPPAGH